jgi:NADPH2:quinone reductase
MKAAVYMKTGTPDVFQYEEVADPSCGVGEIVIEVRAISVEGGDILNRSSGELVNVPHCVGYQAAGVVIEVGGEVTDRQVGQRVATMGKHGAYAEKRPVRATNSWLIPDTLTFEQAVCVPVTFGTAHDCLFEFGRLAKGETVLINAGAGGVGVAAIQLAKRAGARVLATASSDERLQQLTELGMDEGINYLEKDLAKESKRHTGGVGVNLVIDPVGGEVLQKSLAALAYRGRLVTLGLAGRDFRKYDIFPLLTKNCSISGYYQVLEIGSERMQQIINQMLAEVGSGELKVIFDKQFPLSDAAGAHQYVESRQAVGRVLLIP